MFTVRELRIDPEDTKRKVERIQREHEKYLDFEPEQLTIDPKWLEVDMSEGASNTPKFTQSMTKEEQEASNKALIKEIDDTAKAKIESDQKLTDKQVKYAEQVAQKYKTIKIGSQTIKEIIETTPDDQVATNELEFLENDSEIVDKSMLKSSVATFEHDYMKKMFLISYIANAAMVLLIMVSAHWLVRLYDYPDEAYDIALKCLYLCLSFQLVTYPLSFTTPAILKATSDVKYVMYSAISSMPLIPTPWGAPRLPRFIVRVW